MNALRNSRTLRDVAVILAASAALTLPVYLFGIPSGNDLPHHFRFALTYENALAQGILDPGWSAEANAGYGDVGVRFYPPVTYYVLNIFRLASGDWYDATVLSIAFWFFLGGLGTYFLAREFTTRVPALVAAVAYLALPYHVNQIFNAFFLAEFAAAGILPFGFLFVTRTVRDPRSANVLGLAVAYSFLILTHLPTAVMGSIALLVYGLASLRGPGMSRPLAGLASGAFFGLAAASFYWVRVVLELGWLTHASPAFRSSDYDFRRNFLFAYPIVDTEVYLDRSLWFVDAMFAIALLLAGSAVLIARRREASPGVRPIIVLLLLAVFFATPLSLPLWDGLVPLQSIQFPFRWMSILSLSAAVLSGLGYAGLRDSFRGPLRHAGIIFIGICSIAAVFSVNQVIRPAIFLDREAFAAKLSSLHRSPACECWLPVWADHAAMDAEEPATANGRNIDVTSSGPLERDYFVTAGPPGEARIALFYYPHWTAYINDERVPIGRDETGAITVELPSTAAEIRLRFEEPAYVGLSRYASLLIWSAMAVGLAALLFRARQRSADIHE